MKRVPCIPKACLLLAGIGCLTMMAQNATPPAIPPFPGNQPVSVEVKILPPKPRSPVERFRQLLALSPARRQQELAPEPEALRKTLLAKLAEYDALPPGERESRLQMTELRWVMVPLMRQTPDQRGDYLALVPAGQRQLIGERLAEWDRLPPGLQKQVLDHEGVLHYFVRLESTPPVLRDLVLNTLTEGQQQKFVERVNEWQALPAGDRRRIYASFQRFFDLDVKEKQRLLKALPDTEQSEMEKTLVAFQKLSRDERQDCLVSFQKLAAMNATERVKFLHGAERWVALPEEERQTWRALAAYLPPLPGTDLQTKPPLPSPNSTTPVPQLPGTGVPKVEPPAK